MTITWLESQEEEKFILLRGRIDFAEDEDLTVMLCWRKSCKWRNKRARGI